MKPLSSRGQQALQELIDLWSATLREEIPQDMRVLLDKLSNERKPHARHH